MSDISALELQTGDLLETKTGRKRVAAIRVSGHETFITLEHVTLMQFKVSEVNYSADRNPVFNVSNR